MTQHRPSRRPSRSPVPRRTVLQGIGVTMALPWMESLAGFGSTEAMAAAARAKELAGAPKRFAVVFQGNGINPNHWWAKGSGAAMELSQTLQPLEKRQDQDQRHRRPVQQVRDGQRHPSGHDRQPADRRAAQARRDHAQRRQHGPDARQPHRPGHRAVEPGARLRGADDRLPRDQLLERLRLAHLVAERRLADAERDVSLARLRQPVREPRQHAQHQRPRPREGARRDAAPADRARRIAPSWTST